MYCADDSYLPLPTPPCSLLPAPLSGVGRGELLLPAPRSLLPRVEWGGGLLLPAHRLYPQARYSPEVRLIGRAYQHAVAEVECRGGNAEVVRRDHLSPAARR